MRLIGGTSADSTGRYVGTFVAQRIAHVQLADTLGSFTALGVVDDAGDLRGGAIYHNYVPAYRSIEVTFALEPKSGIRTWLTRPVIAGIMAYPFSQLLCGRVTAITPKSSASARRFLETFGFKREGVARDGFGDFGDAVIYGLTRKDWSESRFNVGSRLDGQESPRAAACA